MTYAQAYELARLCYQPTAKAPEIAFWRFVVSGAAYYCEGADVNWKGPYAIFVQETGYGTSKAALKGNNLFGISHPDEDGTWQPNEYPNTLRCCEHFLQVLHRPNYAKAWENRQLPAVFLEKLHTAKPSYNANASWLTGCLAALAQVTPLVL